jgi:RND family efflux transporter MFP subunit
MDPEKLTQLKISKNEPAAPRAKSLGKRLVLLILLVALGLFIGQLYRQGALTPATAVRLSTITMVYPSQVITELNASGYVVAQSKAAVASKGTGRLVALEVQEGSRVHKGDVIARLENDDLQADVDQTKAQLAAAKASLNEAESELTTSARNWQRFKILGERDLIARAEVDTARDRWAKAKAAVEGARANIKASQAAWERAAILLEYALIRAPFDGVILTKNADVGEVVTPFAAAANAKAAVVTIADLGSLMVETDVAEAFLPKVQLDQPCEIQLDALPHSRFAGKVDTIVPTADRTKGTVLVKVRFAELDPRVLPEMSARVAFLARPLSEPESHPLLAVHRDALVQRNGVNGIFLMKDARVQWVLLPSVQYMGDYVLLSPPLQTGEQAVLKPAPSLQSGTKVKVAE